MKLYDYFRSSAAYRVRIALDLKGIAWEPVPVHLTRDGGEQRNPDYTAINPQKLIPAIDAACLALDAFDRVGVDGCLHAA